MENKKISFGFKVNKKPEIVSKASKEAKPLELIDCFENQAIKIKDAVEVKIQPLVIPIRGSSNKLLDEIKKAKEKRVKTEIKQEEDVKPDSALTLDELAARELIREAQNRDNTETETKVFALPQDDDKFVAEGAPESSLADYESVPISDYGMAMLRGMNWTEGMPIGRRSTATSEPPKIPELRPRGLGLGANKLISSNKPSVDKNGRELQLIRGAFAKIIAGNHKGHYCQVQGLDDENCKVVVKTSLTNEILSLNEFLIVPVTSEEYSTGSKVINNVKYEEYQDRIKKEDEKRGGNDRSRSRDRDKSDSEDSNRSRSKSRKKSKKKSKSSDAERDKRKHKKKKSKAKHQSSGSESESRKTRKHKEKRR